MRLRSIASAFSVLLAACSQGAIAVPDAGGQTVPDAGGPAMDSGQTLDGKCVGDLATIGEGCPPTFDGSEANLPACDTRFINEWAQQSVWHCQDLIIFQESNGFGGGVCYYDATSHALVGAEWGSDIGVYCGQTSLTIEAGRTNSMCRENAPTTQRLCVSPDGSAG